MERRYWLHRISHEWKASYPLLEQGYLSIGWSDLMSKNLPSDDENEFRRITEAHNFGSVSRWSLWRFLRFAKGDWVVVPLFDKKFMIVEVTGDPRPAKHYPEASVSDGSLTVGQEGVCGDDGAQYDIGFLVPVKALTEHLPRSYSPANLVSRMKLRQTTADISDLSQSVQEAQRATGPITLHDPLISAVTETISELINSRVTPDNLEHLLRWYMEKKGASRVYIPAKNESGKRDGADADVVAEFDDLGIIFYIQAKKHTSDSETSQWAVHQISAYMEQNDADSRYTYIPWVVSTGHFQQEAVELADKNHVRLIDGAEFIRMLIDCGIADIDSALG